MKKQVDRRSDYTILQRSENYMSDLQNSQSTATAGRGKKQNHYVQPGNSGYRLIFTFYRCRDPSHDRS